LREVEEETGVKSKIVSLIPGSFPGSTTDNEYFLMVPVEDTKKFGDETQSVRWVTQSDAEQLIGQTKNSAGRKRDLKLLGAAFTERLRL
jgi:8-oxo-dGTP pyrophosphatase MutT (NUDIX family)